MEENKFNNTLLSRSESLNVIGVMFFGEDNIDNIVREHTKLVEIDNINGESTQLMMEIDNINGHSFQLMDMTILTGSPPNLWK